MTRTTLTTLLLLAACDRRGDGTEDTGADTAADTGDTGVGGDTADTGDSGDTGDTGGPPPGRVVGAHALADEAALVVRGDAGDMAGSAVAAGDLDGDGVAEVAVGAPGADGGKGAVVVFAGGTTGEVDRLDAVATLLGGAGEALGTGLAILPDTDGDGYADLSAGAPLAGERAGHAVLFSGPLDGAAASATVDGAAANDQLGVEVGWAGDQDGDGLPEWMVGAWMADTGGADAGATYLFRRPTEVGALEPDDALATLNGVAASDWSGYGFAGGADVDGDGQADLLVGADGVDRPGDLAGAAFLLLGPVAGDVSLADADALISGAAASEFAGHAVTFLREPDGRGRVVVGAFGSDRAGDRAGMVAVFDGVPAGAVTVEDADTVVSPTAADALFGYALAGPGDVDGDGLGDLVVSARDDGTAAPAAGAAWVLYGAVSDAADTSTNAAVLLGEGEGDEAGYVVGGGDVDGDGRADVVVGAWKQGGDDAGAAYVWTGRE